MTRIAIFRKFLHWFQSLSPRERIIVGAALAGLGVFILSWPVSWVGDTIDQNKRLVVERSLHVEDIGRLARRYKDLNNRFEKLQGVFEESQVTFEEATRELDRVVKESIGSDNYDLDDSRSASPIGLEYEKQTFILKVKSLSLEQAVKLFYNLEQGKSPLFLGKADLKKTARDGELAATLEIYTIRKSSA